jgi:predicted molibdopterin-dependent oxidoreductase YjgC
MSKQIKLTVDGIIVSVPEGATILQAAEYLGTTIPTLCHDDRLEPHGGCRLCVVEVEGMRGLPPSCSTRAREGMVVKTNTPLLTQVRKSLIELLLADHPAECTTCIGNLHCSLQNMAAQFGIRERRLRDLPRKSVFDDSHPLFSRDLRKCVLCAKCVRVCREINGAAAIDLTGRGFDTKVEPFGDLPIIKSICEACGECVEACPTAALTEKKIVGHLWQLEQIPTTCPYCGVGCQIDLHVNRQENRIVRVTGRRKVAPNDGMLCVKGRFAYDFVSSPKRLSQPMIRKNGKQEAVSWEEALDYTARRLRDIRREHGPDTICAVASSRDNNENVYAVAKFMRAAIGTNNVDNCART